MSFIHDNYGGQVSQALYYDTLLTIPIDVIADEVIQQNIERFTICKELAIQPYRENYDDQPAQWIDFCLLMIDELRKCEEERIRIGNSDRKVKNQG